MGSETQEESAPPEVDEAEKIRLATEKAEKRRKKLYDYLLGALRDDLTWKIPGPNEYGEFPEEPPEPTALLELPTKPNRWSKTYDPKLSLRKFFSMRWFHNALEESEARFDSDLETWRETTINHNRENQISQSRYVEEMSAYNARKDQWERRYDNLWQRYQSRDAEAISDYSEDVLEAIPYPESFEIGYEAAYRETRNKLVIKVNLPKEKVLPRTKTYQMDTSTGQKRVVLLAEEDIERMYHFVESVICLRALYALFAGNPPSVVEQIEITGRVPYLDPSVGFEKTRDRWSLTILRDHFESLNLEAVEPVPCFERLRRDFENALNLLAISPYEFEKLVGWAMQMEFGHNAKVEVTQKGNDGGIDVRIRQEGSLKGGDIIVQAKQYTDNVGVEKVREFFGVLEHEDANKALLVSTTNYTEAARSFSAAQGARIQLISGKHFVKILNKFGLKAKIDVDGAANSEKLPPLNFR